MAESFDQLTLPGFAFENFDGGADERRARSCPAGRNERSPWSIGAIKERLVDHHLGLAAELVRRVVADQRLQSRRPVRRPVTSAANHRPPRRPLKKNRRTATRLPTTPRQVANGAKIETGTRRRGFETQPRLGAPPFDGRGRMRKKLAGCELLGWGSSGADRDRKRKLDRLACRPSARSSPPGSS